MHRPLDLGGLEILVAIAALVAGTVVFCLVLALAARLVDRAWDRLEGEGGVDDRSRERGASSGSARARRRLGAGVPRPVLWATLAAALLSALGWLAFTVSRLRGFG